MKRSFYVNNFDKTYSKLLQSNNKAEVGNFEF